jgi:hypothetical protein
VKAGTPVLALVAVLGFGALCAPLARAGSYDVVSCSIDGGFYPNRAWVAGNNPAGNPAYQTDSSCTQQAGNSLAVSLAPNTAYGNGTYAALWLTAPPQTTITNYKLIVRHYWFAPPLVNYPTERTYTVAGFGGVAYSGTGLFPQGDQDAISAEGHWYGYRGGHQSGAADSGVVTLTRASSKRALAVSNASVMTLSAGCFTDDGSACSLGTDGAGNVGTALLQLFGSRVTISDATAPALTDPTADQGLRAPGTRSGDEPLTFTASDNVGIRRAEIVDVTDANAPRVVAAEDYASTPTDQMASCDFTRTKPCPDLKAETIAASPAIAGRRTILLRVTDSAGNQTVSAPFAITARGPLNGAGGGDGARLVAGFPGHSHRGRGKSRHRVGVLRPTKTVGFGHGALVRGVLRNAAGQPVAGAELRLLVRELKLGSHYTDRGAITTTGDGRFSLRIVRGASRRVRIAYRAYPGDAGLTAKSDVTLKTKARVTLRAPRRVKSFGTARFRGSLKGRPLPPNGVTLELQAHQPGRGWRTVKTTRTRKGGAYSTRYRFNSGAGRFTFRVRLRPNDSYPYSLGRSRPVRVRVG